MTSPDDSSIDLGRIERAVVEILLGLGEDPGRDGLQETPRRVASAFAERFGGYGESPERHVRTHFAAPVNDLILIRGLDFSSACEHHLLPFFGEASVAIAPGTSVGVPGLSKVGRLVDGFARRLQMQERLSAEIADALFNELDAAGVLVVVEAEHMCMSLRGVRKQNSSTVTVVARGSFEANPEVRREALALMRAP